MTHFLMGGSKGERYVHLNNRLQPYGDHKRGDCGIEISNLQQSDFGVWRCRVQRVGATTTIHDLGSWGQVHDFQFHRKTDRKGTEVFGLLDMKRAVKRKRNQLHYRVRHQL